MDADSLDLEAFCKPTYVLTADDATNIRISAILNEADHVFNWHAEGIWKSTYKEKYARLLSRELAQRPSLMRKILKFKKRVFTMVAYRAIDMLKESKNG